MPNSEDNQKTKHRLQIKATTLLSENQKWMDELTSFPDPVKIINVGGFSSGSDNSPRANKQGFIIPGST